MPTCQFLLPQRTEFSFSSFGKDRNFSFALSHLASQQLCFHKTSTTSGGSSAGTGNKLGNLPRRLSVPKSVPREAEGRNVFLKITLRKSRFLHKPKEICFQPKKNHRVFRSKSRFHQPTIIPSTEQIEGIKKDCRSLMLCKQARVRKLAQTVGKMVKMAQIFNGPCEVPSKGTELCSPSTKGLGSYYRRSTARPKMVVGRKSIPKRFPNPSSDARYCNSNRCLKTWVGDNLWNAKKQGASGHSRRKLGT